MRCKPGDLAYVVGPAKTPGLVGRVVRVIRQAEYGESFERLCCGGFVRFTGNPVGSWVCESSSPLPWLVSDKNVTRLVAQRPISDTLLRPIRDNDGEDEILRIAGKPHEVTA